MDLWLKTSSNVITEKSADSDFQIDENIKGLLSTTKVSLIEPQNEIQEASDSIIVPLPVVMQDSALNLTGNEAKVYFDLETGGLSHGADILQIAAVCGGQAFDKYVTPMGRIQRQSSRITGITCRQGIVRVNGRRVFSIPIASALCQFTDWLRRVKPCILIAHNSRFDSQHLLHHLCCQNMESKFVDCVSGFVDSITIFKAYYPKMTDYKQTTLVMTILGKKYAAHNALADVRALKQLMEASNVTQNSLIQHGYSTSSALHSMNVKQDSIENNISLQPLIDENFLSAGMASKIAQSGLHLCHLQLLYDQGSVDGVHAAFSAITQNGQVRVSKCRKISEKLSLYFQQK